MVRGLARFSDHFRGFESYFIVIGGTACELWLSSRGMGFRRTRDIDLMLIIEQMDRGFAARFRAFIAAGGYTHVVRRTGIQVNYRFTNPTAEDFPEMLELFSRRASRLALVPRRQVARLDNGQEPVSLSAILMDDTYYDLVRHYRIEQEGVPSLSAGALIPMKAWAWLNLSSNSIFASSLPRCLPRLRNGRAFNTHCRQT